MTLTLEAWRPVVGFEGTYEVSDLGRVRSLDRVVYAVNRWGVVAPRFYRGKVLAPAPTRNGYLQVNTQINRQVTPCQIHVAVLRAFRGPAPLGMVGRHLNGRCADNWLDNLAWGTYVENMADKRLHGTHLEGEEHPCAELDDFDVVCIRAMVGARKQRDIADMYGITQQHVSNIVRRKRRAVR